MTASHQAVERQTTPPVSTPFKLTEDWLATIVGLLIVFLIGAGVLGPGPQRVGLKAAPGETAVQAIRPLSGWQVSATLAGERTPVENAVKRLEAGKVYAIGCQGGALSALETPPADAPAPSADQAQLVIVNNCDAEVTLNYRINAAVPWPVFNLFAQ